MSLDQGEEGVMAIEPTQQEPTEYCWCLVAVSGDCSSTGMSDKSECIVLLNEDGSAVWHQCIQDYLSKQLDITCLRARKGISTEDIESLEDIELANHHEKELSNLFDTLVKFGIFSHKYHRRTEWMLAAFDEGAQSSVFDKVEFRRLLSNVQN
jgi:hypothetical protein